MATLQRRMSFGKFGLLGILSGVVNGAVAITLALRGFGAWSLVWGMVTSSIVQLFAAHVLARYRPRIRFEYKAFRSLFGFGSALTVKNLFVYLVRNADYFLVGKRLGVAPLGFYTRAFNLMSIPQKELVAQTNRVSFPAFSRIQDDRQRICEWFLKSSQFVAFLSIPVFFGLALLARDFTIVVYTEKWLPMVTALRILALAGSVRVLHSLGGPILEATGRVRLEAVIWLGNAVVLFGTCYIGSFWGIEGVALGVLCTSILMYCVRVLVLRKIVRLPVAAYLRIPSYPVLCSLLACGAVTIAGEGLPSSWTREVLFLVEVMVFVATYFSLMFLLAREKYGIVFEEGRRLWDGMSPAVVSASRWIKLRITDLQK
jgi:O-antigen/teichoic acid export membrane protein